MRMEATLSIFLFLLLGTSNANIFKKLTSPCKPTNIQCLSENTFTYCVNKGKQSALMNFVFNCPEHYVCDDSTKFPCVKNTISAEGGIASNEVDPAIERNVLIEQEPQSGPIIITTPKLILVTSGTSNPEATVTESTTAEVTETESTTTEATETESTTAEATETESTTAEATTPASMTIESKISSTQDTDSSAITEVDAMPTIIKLLISSFSDTSSDITAPSKISFSNSFVIASDINSQKPINRTKPSTNTLSSLMEEASTTTTPNDYSTLLPDHADPITPNISAISTTTIASTYIPTRTALPTTIAPNIIIQKPASIPSPITTPNENLLISKKTPSPVTLIRSSYTKNCTSNTTIVNTHSPNTSALISGNAAPLTFPLNSQTIERTANSSIPNIVTPITVEASRPILNTIPSALEKAIGTTTTAPMFRIIPPAPDIKVSLNKNNKNVSVTSILVPIKSQFKGKSTTSTQTTPLGRAAPTVIPQTRSTTARIRNRATKRPVLKTRTTPSVRFHKRPLHINKYINKIGPNAATFRPITVPRPTPRDAVRNNHIITRTEIDPILTSPITRAALIEITKTIPPTNPTTIPWTIITRTTTPAASSTITTPPSPITRTTSGAITTANPTTIPWTIITRTTTPAASSTITTPPSPITRTTPGAITPTNPSTIPWIIFTRTTIPAASTTVTTPHSLIEITRTTPIAIPQTNPITPPFIIVTRTTPQANPTTIPSIITTTEATTETITDIDPPECTASGFHPATNCNQYYECVAVWWWYEYRLRTCNTGHYYNATQKTCVLDAGSICS